jgi:hypothetical protein
MHQRLVDGDGTVTRRRSSSRSGSEQDPPRRLPTIDWNAVRIASDADALALWTKIAPTGAD